MTQKLQYVFDTSVYSQIRNLRLKYAKPKKCKLNPLFGEDYFGGRFWEARYDNAFSHVFYDPFTDKYRAYFGCFAVDKENSSVPLAERPGRQYHPTNERLTSLQYAESDDGLHWVKPNLGIVEFGGSSANNILMLGAHGASVFLDENETNSDRRYKMCLRNDISQNMETRYSRDGLHFNVPLAWKPNPRPIVADTFNFALYDPLYKGYRCYTRVWMDGMRIEYGCESKDFETWENPREIIRGNGKDDQIYAMSVFWRNGVCFGLPNVYHDGDRELSHWEKMDTEFCYSSDGLHFNRILPGTALIPRGKGDYPDGEYDSGCITVSTPIEDKRSGRLLFYYMGSNGRHANYRETGLCRAEFETDKIVGFAVAHERNGESGIYRTIEYPEKIKKLYLIADYKRGGRIKLYICRKDGERDFVGAADEKCGELTLPYETRGVSFEFELFKCVLYAFTLEN